MSDESTAVSGAKLYKSLKTLMSVNEGLSNDEKREIMEMVMDEEL